jgi:hypothetical protein
MNQLSRLLAGIILILLASNLTGQQLANIKGRITSEDGSALTSATIGIQGSNLGVMSMEDGSFEMKVPAYEELIIVVSYLGFTPYQQNIKLATGQTYTLNIELIPEVKQLQDVEIMGIGQRENTLIPINIRSINQLPNTSGNIESIIKTFPGVSSGNELSSQYSVRGGSFDENLVYVNDIEIYRPMLVQSAQQEGLSFVNPSMVSSIQFSSGGFDAEYGDKLSSVLDIRYKQPTSFSGSVSGSFMGGTMHIEGTTKDKRFTHITGFRYKTNKLLLATLDTKGDFNPSFSDLQTYLTYDLTKKLELSFLGNLAINKFDRVPTYGETILSSLQNTLVFNIYYEGREIDKFQNYLGALTLNYHPNEKLMIKFIGSAFKSDEKITYDILKEYRIGEARQSNSGSRDSVVNIGIGAELIHARDYLKSTIYSGEHKGTLFIGAGVMKWGIKAQIESVDDWVNEWQMIDSADYSIPNSSEELNLRSAYKSNNSMQNLRFAAFVQHTFNFTGQAGKISFTLGARSQWWSYNKQITFSPRGNIVFIPAKYSHISWHLSSGIYHQPPFYKELRDETGQLYPGKKAQQAFHLVAGNDINLILWKRAFVFTSEMFYKSLTNVIPYKLDDVRLQYLPMYDAKAYAAGIDIRLYGEFVPGTESWFSLSLLRTREDLKGDFLVDSKGKVTYPGYYSRPTDQLLNFSILFQDYLPMNPNYKVHLMLIYGTGLTYSGPLYSRPSDIYELGPYRRVDVGFSRLITGNKQKKIGIKSIWIGGEILNLLGAENRVSLDWVRTVESDMGVDAYFAIPNKLTGRLFNLKVTVNF